jgi:hypothetical protein
MNNKQNISFEDILKEYEKNKNTLPKNKNKKISPFIIKAVEEFKKLVNQIKEEVKGKENKKS